MKWGLFLLYTSIPITEVLLQDDAQCDDDDDSDIDDIEPRGTCHLEPDDIDVEIGEHEESRLKGTRVYTCTV